MKITSFDTHNADCFVLKAKTDTQIGDEKMEKGDTKKVSKSEARRILETNGADFDLLLD